MTEYIFIGGSHGIAHATIEKRLHQDPHAKIHLYSREAGSWASHPSVNWKAYDVLEAGSLNLQEVNFSSFGGFVYAPGTVNLRPFTSFKLEDFKNDFEINFFGCVRALQLILPKAKSSTLNPSFVFFSTVATLKGLPMHSSIASAKAALEGLCRSLAAEYAPKFRFNCVAPSLTETPLTESLTSRESTRKISEEKHPLKRLGKAEEIASTVNFLLGPESSWMTGQILRPDGGMSL